MNLSGEPLIPFRNVGYGVSATWELARNIKDELRRNLAASSILFLLPI
jgi:hypothetical protein